MTKVLMVCLGNICRSPLAEGILKSKASDNDIYVDSAGTAGYHVGELPDKRSIDIAKKNGIDITDQRSRKFKVEDFDSFDFILVMDTSNYQNVLALARNDQDIAKVKMILGYSPTSETEDVPDPYYGGSQGFKKVYDLLNQACDHFIEALAH